MLVLLWALLFVWIFYFYGTEERTEKFSKLQDGNTVIRTIDIGVILGVSTVGFISILLLLV